jgi:hypothetical protein
MECCRDMQLYKMVPRYCCACYKAILLLSSTRQSYRTDICERSANLLLQYLVRVQRYRTDICERSANKLLSLQYYSIYILYVPCFGTIRLLKIQWTTGMLLCFENPSGRNNVAMQYLQRQLSSNVLENDSRL